MRIVWILALAAVLVTGCGHRKHASGRKIPAPPRAPAAMPNIGDTETGIASWYGHPYHGRRAANGEIYDMETLVAAHRTLPFDTWVKVVNLSNDQSVEVRIIDRGPFVDGRVIDLSHKAAQAISMIGPGTARVRIEVIRTPPTAPPGLFAVQVGAFRERDNAERLRARLAAAYGSAKLVERPGDRSVWRVLVGSEPTEDAAETLAAKIRSEFGEKAAFVLRLDTN